MPTSVVPGPAEGSAFARRRVVALANTRWFRAMAWRALHDGAPKGQQRAANARAAAHIVIRQAKHENMVNRMATEAEDDP